jgi:NAD(P)-dependent dehydrogenase (short-subunit alcohol dehydrogenase family)
MKSKEEKRKHMLLKDKVVLITGGAKGIGAATVKIASEQGAKVAILDLDMDAATALEKEVENTKAYKIDVTSLENVTQTIDQVVADFGRLDGAVNSAGIGGNWGNVLDVSVEDWHLCHDVNLNGMFYCLRAELKHMVATGGGSIVNLASLAGVLAEDGLSPYVSAKHGVVGLTKSVTLDFAAKGIRTNAVCPAFVRTPMTEPLFQDPGFIEMVKKSMPNGRVVEAEEVANVCLFLLSDLSTAVTGTAQVVDGGLAVK